MIDLKAQKATCKKEKKTLTVNLLKNRILEIEKKPTKYISIIDILLLNRINKLA